MKKTLTLLEVSICVPSVTEIFAIVTGYKEKFPDIFGIIWIWDCRKLHKGNLTI
jgi:hypothetical protein